MSSLFARLSLALLILTAAVGGGFFLIEQWSTGQYYEELTQRLNAPIAMYVTDQAALIKDGEVNKAEMARLAEQAMVINPTAEVYLLDKAGRILDHALPPDTVQLSAVDMEPVHALINASRTMPIRGSDPRNPADNKVFSAHPVLNDGQLEGYLYVILGGRKYEELASNIRGSYVGTVSLSAIVALVAAAFITGLLVFSLLTRRLTRLTAAVQTFSDSNFAPESSDAISQLQLGKGKSWGADGHNEGNNNGGKGRDKKQSNSRDEILQLSSAVQGMANKIAELFDGLKETDRLRRELISNVSHDLRTPLASMLGYVDTLLLKNDQLSSAEREHYLEVVRNHTRRLETMIGDLFELSKLEADSVRPNMESFVLAELLQDVCQEFELEAERRDITINIEYERGASSDSYSGNNSGNKSDKAVSKAGPSSLMVYADIALVQRVLENLLRNALNFTTNGGSISLSLKARADKVAVSVVDTGRGIPADKLDTIFERFYTSGTSMPVESEADNNSTGLGLAIVKRILDLHGCRITVSSVVDEGSCFEFDLPVARLA